MDRYSGNCRGSTPSVWYRDFLAFWVAAAAMLPEDVDLMVDSEALAHSLPYRLGCEIELARLTGRMVDFGDVESRDDMVRGGRAIGGSARSANIHTGQRMPAPKRFSPSTWARHGLIRPVWTSSPVCWRRLDRWR